MRITNDTELMQALDEIKQLQDNICKSNERIESLWKVYSAVTEGDLRKAYALMDNETKKRVYEMALPHFEVHEIEEYFKKL